MRRKGGKQIARIKRLQEMREGTPALQADEGSR